MAKLAKADRAQHRSLWTAGPELPLPGSQHFCSRPCAARRRRLTRPQAMDRLCRLNAGVGALLAQSARSAMSGGRVVARQHIEGG